MGTKILYHNPCADGFGAAWAAWMALGNKAEYLPCSYNHPLPYIHPGDRVYFVDFSTSREALKDIAKIAEKVIVLDHHKTAMAALEGLQEEDPDKFVIQFDMNKSGAVLAWEYFHPLTPVPALLAHIGDRDIWQFKLPYTEELCAAVRGYPLDFEVWRELAGKTSELIQEGTILLKKQKQEVEAHVQKNVPFIKIDGYSVPAVNASVHHSEIGNELCKKYPDAPFSVTYVINGPDLVAVSLRSIGEFDVSEVAKKFGGGGHKNASGCRCDLATLSKFFTG